MLFRLASPYSGASSLALQMSIQNRNENQQQLCKSESARPEQSAGHHTEKIIFDRWRSCQSTPFAAAFKFDSLQASAAKQTPQKCDREDVRIAETDASTIRRPSTIAQRQSLLACPVNQRGRPFLNSVNHSHVHSFVIGDCVVCLPLLSQRDLTERAHNLEALRARKEAKTLTKARSKGRKGYSDSKRLKAIDVHAADQDSNWALAKKWTATITDIYQCGLGTPFWVGE